MLTRSGWSVRDLLRSFAIVLWNVIRSGCPHCFLFEPVVEASVHESSTMALAKRVALEIPCMLIIMPEFVLKLIVTQSFSEHRRALLQHFPLVLLLETKRAMKPHSGWHTSRATLEIQDPPIPWPKCVKHVVVVGKFVLAPNVFFLLWEITVWLHKGLYFCYVWVRGPGSSRRHLPCSTVFLKRTEVEISNAFTDPSKLTV